MGNDEGTSLAPAPAKRSIRWPLIVIGLLGAHVVLMLAAAAIATSDRSFTVLPNYYQNALHWDESQAAQRASDALGWKLAIEPSTRINPLGQRAITITLTDALDQPVENATLHLSCYHHARASQPIEATLSPTAPGKYESSLPMRYAGVWQFDIVASAGGRKFISSTSQSLSNEIVK